MTKSNEMVATITSRLIALAEQEACRRVLGADCMADAIRRDARDLGWLLYLKGGTSVMCDVLWRVDPFTRAFVGSDVWVGIQQAQRLPGGTVMVSDPWEGKTTLWGSRGS